MAKPADGGKSRGESQISTEGSNFSGETRASRRNGPWDFIYVWAAGGRVVAAWTGCRDLVPGIDPRETSASDDHHGSGACQPCAYVRCGIDAVLIRPSAVSDPCRSHGALDQRIDAATP